MCRRLAVAVVLAATLACSAPPDTELHQAEGAIAAAKAADAAAYAPDELASAEAAYQKYDAAVAQRDYRQALRLAIAARDTAYEAARQAGDSKAAARGQAERLIADVTALVQQAERQVASSGLRPQSAAAVRLRGAVASAAAPLQEARSQVERQDFRAVTKTLEPVAADLRRVLTDTAPVPTRRDR